MQHHQLSLFESQRRIVNIASVPHRSLFRYPGGKTWLVPHIRQWLSQLKHKPAILIEPFAGGGIVGLTAVFENLVDRAIFVERDEEVAAVWRTLLSREDAMELGNRLTRFDLSSETIEEVLNKTPETTGDLAFQTILKNRINRGGILATGAGRIKQGEKGKGLSSRWYPQTLKRRILDIVEIQDRLTFIEGDGLAEIERYLNYPDAVFFIDPPYTAAGKRAGKRLYKYSDIDHDRLFTLAKQLKGSFLMTYDNGIEIQERAALHDLETRSIAMKNTHHARLTELLIGQDLSWFDRFYFSS